MALGILALTPSLKASPIMLLYITQQMLQSNISMIYHVQYYFNL